MNKNGMAKFVTSTNQNGVTSRPPSPSQELASIKAGKNVADEVMKKFDEWLSSQGKFSKQTSV